MSRTAVSIEYLSPELSDLIYGQTKKNISQSRDIISHDIRKSVPVPILLG